MLHVHRAARADRLAEALARLLAEPPVDPFTPDVVAVPTRGMERWLTQRTSAVLGARPGDSDGVCANVLFPTPHRLIADAVATASGVDPLQDPWLPERAVWPLLDVVREGLQEPWLSGLATYLGADADPPDPAKQTRRLSVVRDTTPTSWAARSPPAPPGRPSYGAGCARGSASPAPPSAANARSSACVRIPGCSTSRSDSLCSGSPGSPPDTSRC
jgi:exodeoxyribonuclease V gamma subunit